MKNLVIGVVSLLIVAVIGLLVAPGFIDWSKYKDQGLAQVKTMTGYDVTIGGDFSLAFLPFPHVNAEQVKVVNPAVSNDPLASFDKLSVSVALMPLLSKQVQVDEITLVKPVFDLRIGQDGKGNWLSPEIEAMMSKGGKASSAPSKQAEVSFDQITIEKGNFRFADLSKGSVTEVSDIDLELNAKSLHGPFNAEGDLVFGGQNIVFEAQTGAIDNEAKTVSVNTKVLYGDYAVEYKGIAAIAQPYEAQGDVAVLIQSLPGFDGKITLGGALDANEKAVSLKNVVLKVGDKDFAGSVEATLAPVNVKAALQSNEILDLDQYLPKSQKQNKQQGDIAALTDLLPKSMTLPQEMNADITLALGGVIYNKELFKGITAKVVKNGQSFSASANVNELPGKGPAIIKGDLKFADVSTSKTGGQVFSDPTLNVDIQANSQNTGYLVQALSGQNTIPVVSSSKIGKFAIKARAVPGAITVSDSVVNLDDLQLSLGGSLKRTDKGRAAINADVKANTINLDDIMAAQVKQGAASGGSAGGDPMSALDLPFDLDAKVSANSLVYNGETYRNVGVSADVTQSAKNISVQAFGGSASVQGASLESLQVRVQHPNLKQAADNFGAALPEYKSLAGPVDLSMQVNLDAAGGAIALKDIKGRIAGSDVSGALGYNGSTGKPYVSGDLKFSKLELVSGDKGASAVGSGSSASSGSGASRASSGGGKWSSDAIDSGFLHAMNADFKVSADSILYETWDMKSPSLDVSLKDGALDIKDLKAGMFNGQIAMNAKVSSASASAPVSLSTNANITNVNIGALAYALSGTRQLQGDGTVSFNANVSGSGASQKAIVSSLGGSAKLDGANIVLKGFDLVSITNAVERDNRENILAAVQSLGKGSTAFDTVNGSYAINQGVVTIESMAMNGAASSIVSSGSASLPQWTLDTKHTVSFNQTDKLDPFTFAIRGPIDNPANTFGNVGNDILKAQAGKFIQKQIQDKLGDTDIGQKLQQFGILPGAQKQQAPANDNTVEPAGGDETPKQQQQPRSQEEQVNDAIQGVLKGLLR